MSFDYISYRVKCITIFRSFFMYDLLQLYFVQFACTMI